jgi:hypothetical protein
MAVGAPPTAAGDAAVVKGDPFAAGDGKPTLRQRAVSRGYTKYGIWGFNSASEYFATLKTMPRLAAARAFYVKDPADAMADREGNELKRTLNWFSVAALGTGMIVGSGIFVSTGERERQREGGRSSFFFPKQRGDCRKRRGRLEKAPPSLPRKKIKNK